jgi:small-conductance mechanosensitive channel
MWLRRLAKTHAWAEVLARGLGHAAVLLVAAVGGWAALVSNEFDPRVEIYARSSLIIAAGLAATLLAARITVSFVRTYATSEDGPLPSTSIFVNLTRVAVWAIGLLIVLNAFEVSITPLLTALGVGGLAVALGMQDTLSNLFAGLSVIASKQIRPGDFIELDSGQLGVVEDVTWRYTTMRMVTNNRIVVPNARLAAAIVTNYQLPDRELTIPVTVGVAYSSDLDHVHAVTCEVAAEVMAEFEPNVMDYEPTVRFREFGESSIEVAALLRVTDFTDQFALRSEFIRRLHRRYAAERIEIPFPQRVVHTRP